MFQWKYGKNCFDGSGCTESMSKLGFISCHMTILQEYRIIIEKLLIFKIRTLLIALTSARSPAGVEVAWLLMSWISDMSKLLSIKASLMASSPPSPLSWGLVRWNPSPAYQLDFYFYIHIQSIQHIFTLLCPMHDLNLLKLKLHFLS